jgi:hypothetical protein
MTDRKFIVESYRNYKNQGRIRLTSGKTTHMLTVSEALILWEDLRQEIDDVQEEITQVQDEEDLLPLRGGI